MGMLTTEISRRTIELHNGEFRDGTLTFAGADTFKRGTILARLAATLAVTASAVAGTGNGTVTAATVVEGPVVPLVGAYKLRATGAATNGGTFRLEDPNGAVVASDLTMTVGEGAATVMEAGGLQWTITDGTTDFAVGDFFTLTVASNGKLVPFDPTGAGGAQRPVAVLTYDVTRASGGDERVRALIAGVINRNALIIHVDGNGDNVTDAIIDQLKASCMGALDVAII